MMKKYIVLCLVLLLAMVPAWAMADDRIPVAENERLKLFLSADQIGRAHV